MHKAVKVKRNLINQHHRIQKKNNLKILKNIRFWLLLFLLSLLLVCTIGPLKIIFDLMFWVHYLQEHQCCIRIPFIIVYILLTVIGIPGTILTLAGGIVFGLWWGTFFSVIGATLGALGAFWTARYLLRNYIKHKFARHKTLSKLQNTVKQNPFLMVLIIRFAPISPFNVVNFLFGLTPMHWLTYTVATFFGIIPGTLAYTWLGTSGINALEGGDRTSLFLALSFLTLLSIIPIIIKTNYKSSNNQQ